MVVAVFAFVGSSGLRSAGFMVMSGPLTALAATAAATPATIAVMAAFAFALFVFVGFGFLGLGTQHCLTIGNRNLVVVWVDFTEGKEAVAVSAIFDKGRLKGRFDARYAGEVDVSFELLFILGLKVEFFDTAAANHDNACFLRVGGVY
jgi:hypothetical protein